MTSSERRQHWQNIINQQVDSGLSKAAFCREQGILEVELPCQTVLRFNESVPPSLLGQYLAVLKA